MELPDIERDDLTGLGDDWNGGARTLARGVSTQAIGAGTVFNVEQLRPLGRDVAANLWQATKLRTRAMPVTPVHAMTS